MLLLLRVTLSAPATTLPSLEPNALAPFGFPPATAVPHDECAVVLARPSESTVELFALGADRALHHRRRTNGNWSEWNPITLPGNVLGGPAVATDGAGRLHVMARGPDNRLWHTQQTPEARSNGSLVEGAAAEGAKGAAKVTAWSQWQRAGTTVADSSALSSPTLTVGADGRVHALALGEGRGVWHGVVPPDSNVPWQWEALGGVWASKPAAIADALGALHVLVVGTDGALWAARLAAGGDGGASQWTAWASLGGRFASVPKISALRQAAGGLRVVARAANRTFAASALRLATNGGTGQWGALSTLPGRPWASGAAVLPAADGGVEVSARAADLAIWHVSVAADGTARRAPQSLGGRFSATPAVMQVSPTPSPTPNRSPNSNPKPNPTRTPTPNQGADGVLEVFARGFDQQIWLRKQQPALATALASTPITAARQQQQQQPQTAEAAAAAGGWGEWASLGGDFLPFPC